MLAQGSQSCPQATISVAATRRRQLVLEFLSVLPSTTMVKIACKKNPVISRTLSIVRKISVAIVVVRSAGERLRSSAERTTTINYRTMLTRGGLTCTLSFGPIVASYSFECVARISPTWRE